MKVLITAVHEGSPEENYYFTPEGIIGGPEDWNINPYNHIVLGQFENDIDIEIRTYADVSKLKNYEFKTVDCLLLIDSFITKGLDEWIEDGYPIYRGKVMGEYIVGSEWKNQSEWKNTVFHAIDTKVGNKKLGIFLITKRQYDESTIEEGENILFTTYSYNIIAWNPLKRK